MNPNHHNLNDLKNILENKNIPLEETIQLAVSKVNEIIESNENDCSKIIHSILANNGVISRYRTSPPIFPSTHNAFIVPDGAVSDWRKYIGYIAYYSLKWNFILPTKGMKVWVDDENIYIESNGKTWSRVKETKK